MTIYAVFHKDATDVPAVVPERFSWLAAILPATSNGRLPSATPPSSSTTKRTATPTTCLRTPSERSIYRRPAHLAAPPRK